MTGCCLYAGKEERRGDARNSNDKAEDFAPRPGSAGDSEDPSWHLAELELRERETRSQLVNAKAKLQHAFLSAAAGRRRPQSARSCNSAALPAALPDATAAADGRPTPVPQVPENVRPSTVSAPRRASFCVVRKEAAQRLKEKKAAQKAQELTVCFVGKLEDVEQGEAEDRVKCARGTIDRAVGVYTSILVMAATMEDGRPTTEAAKYRNYLKLHAQGKTNARIISEQQFLQEFPARGSARTRAANAATSPSQSPAQLLKSLRSGHRPSTRGAARRSLVQACDESTSSASSKAIEQVPSESDLQAYYDHIAELRHSCDDWIFAACPLYQKPSCPVYHEPSHWEEIRKAGKWARKLRQEVDKRLSLKDKNKDGVGSFKDWLSDAISRQASLEPSSGQSHQGRRAVHHMPEVKMIHAASYEARQGTLSREVNSQEVEKAVAQGREEADDDEPMQDRLRTRLRRATYIHS